MAVRYRIEYDGEYVIVDNTIRDGKRHQQREWIENPIQNQHISGRAAVIGNGNSRRDNRTTGFNLKDCIEQHAGWHLGRKRLQSYGSEGCWREMQCDFYVEFDKDKLQELKQENYQEVVSVYTNARNCIDDPGQYYLVPYGVRGNSVAVATWLACFDGHTEIFLIGVDALDEKDEPLVKKIESMNKVISEYTSVNFYYVSDGAKAHDMWRNHANFQQQSYAEFISYCDI
mgnify:CR=1 FL=1|tara:strand:+ start:771 stop:1457 length:687 start_codon:yes stop_codon:yes gene_type:complete